MITSSRGLPEQLIEDNLLLEVEERKNRLLLLSVIVEDSLLLIEVEHNYYAGVVTIVIE